MSLLLFLLCFLQESCNYIPYPFCSASDKRSEVVQGFFLFFILVSIYFLLLSCSSSNILSVNTISHYSEVIISLSLGFDFMIYIHALVPETEGRSIGGFRGESDCADFSGSCEGKLSGKFCCYFLVSFFPRKKKNTAEMIFACCFTLVFSFSFYVIIGSFTARVWLYYRLCIYI